jgi:hypothetical protein
LSASISAVAALPTEVANFLLVTTNQAEATSDTSNLKAVSATSLFVRLSSPISPPYSPQFSFGERKLQQRTTAIRSTAS